jgi:hypothetical protein
MFSVIRLNKTYLRSTLNRESNNAILIIKSYYEKLAAEDLEIDAKMY